MLRQYGVDSTLYLSAGICRRQHHNTRKLLRRALGLLSWRLPGCAQSWTRPAPRCAPRRLSWRPCRTSWLLLRAQLPGQQQLPLPLQRLQVWPQLALPIIGACAMLVWWRSWCSCRKHAQPKRCHLWHWTGLSLRYVLPGACCALCMIAYMGTHSGGCGQRATSSLQSRQSEA